MRRSPLPLTVLAVALAGMSNVDPAAAQARVFVGAQGSDSNACTFTAPCRTFQHAHDVVAAGGEIDVLDPAGYGSLIIFKSISIQGHGYAGISVPHNGIGVFIVAGSTDIISLNGLLIDGGGAGYAGIEFAIGQSLSVRELIGIALVVAASVGASSSARRAPIAV